MSKNFIKKSIVVALATAAIATVAATGNAFAREGGHHGGWRGGYGHGRYFGGHGYWDFYRSYGDYDRCYRFHHRYWGCEDY